MTVNDIQDGKVKPPQKRIEGVATVTLLFDEFCKELGVQIRSSDVRQIVKNPSEADVAVLYLVHRFFEMSPYVHACCDQFGISMQNLVALKPVLERRTTSKERKILRKWIE